MNVRLENEFLMRLARRALHIIAPCLREEEHRDAFDEFHAAFKEELLWFEYETDRVKGIYEIARKRPPREDQKHSASSQANEGQSHAP